MIDLRIRNAVGLAKKIKAVHQGGGVVVVPADDIVLLAEAVLQMAEIVKTALARTPGYEDPVEAPRALRNDIAARAVK
jgi:hypothetical protein